MANELDKVLSRMKVTIKSRELIGTPGRGFTPGLRCWRVGLERAVRGVEKPLRLSLTVLSAGEPTPADVLRCLTSDVQSGELSLWDFAQAHGNGKTDLQTERMHKSCKRIGPRVKRFFGDGWPNVVNHTQKAA
jgi:hypothetical protein